MPYLTCPNCGASLPAAEGVAAQACPNCCARLLPSERVQRVEQPRDGSRVHAALAGDVTAPKRARLALERLGEDLDEEALESAQLVVTELVTNAVKHADGGSSEIDVWLDDGRLRIEVSDHGSGFEPSNETNGWGLHIVDELADDWGIGTGPGTRVWCEFAVNGAEAN